VEDREQRDDREARERRAEDLRRRIGEIVRGEPGERPPPGSPREYIEEQMREEAERRGSEEGDSEDQDEEEGR
jgi:hypothetical protein